MVPSCVAHRSNGGPCTKFRMHGGTVCDTHGGTSPQVRAKALQRVALADAGKQLGIAVEVDPTQALLHMLWISYGDVAFWSHLVADLKRGGVDLHGNGLVVTGAQGATQAHVFIEQYNEAQKRAAHFAKMAKDAGIEERKVQVLEEQAQMLAEVGRRFVAKLTIVLSLTQQQTFQVRELFREQLALIEPTT